MRCFNNYCNSQRLKGLLDAVTDLGGESFLDLKATGEGLDHTGDLAQTGDGSVRDVCDMSLADERHHMVLTGRIKLDVLDKDHLLVFFLEHCASKYLSTVLLRAVSEELEGLGNALRGLYKSLSFRIFTEKPEDFPIVFCNCCSGLLVVSSSLR